MDKFLSNVHFLRNSLIIIKYTLKRKNKITIANEYNDILKLIPRYKYQYSVFTFWDAI